jgi:acetolactate synthase-1/2/3 large subunit
MWTAQHYKFVHPRSMITSGGLGTMGFGLPAAIGAQFAIKDRPIVCISGDGGFQMNIQELITAAAHKLPIKFFIINNGFLGMVRQWQELFHAEKYSFTDLSQSNPDFVKVAIAFGLEAFRVDKVEDVDATLDKVFAINDKPSLIDFRVERSDMVFPMVPAGGTVAEIMTKRLNPKLMV